VTPLTSLCLKSRREQEKKGKHNRPLGRGARAEKADPSYIHSFIHLLDSTFMEYCKKIFTYLFNSHIIKILHGSPSFYDPVIQLPPTPSLLNQPYRGLYLLSLKKKSLLYGHCLLTSNQLNQPLFLQIILPLKMTFKGQTFFTMFLILLVDSGP
jgi:hypothetical protein